MGRYAFTIGLSCLSLLWAKPAQLQASGFRETATGVKGKGLSDSSILLSHVAFAALSSPPWPAPGLPVLPAASGDAAVQLGLRSQQSGRPGMQAVVFLASVSAAVVKVNTSPPVFVREAPAGGTEPLSPI